MPWPRHPRVGVDSAFCGPGSTSEYTDQSITNEVRVLKCASTACDWLRVFNSTATVIMIAAGDEFGVIRTVRKPHDANWGSAVASGLCGERDKAHGVSWLSTATVGDTAVVMAARVNGTLTLHAQGAFTEAGHLDVSGSCGVVTAQLATPSEAVVAACEDGRLEVQKLRFDDSMVLKAEDRVSIDTGTTLGCCVVAPGSQLAAVGAKGREVTMWDLNDGTNMIGLSFTACTQ